MAEKFIGGLTLRCATCELPYARLQNGVLIIESRHHGQIHVNTIPIAVLLQQNQPAEKPDEAG